MEGGLGTLGLGIIMLRSGRQMKLKVWNKQARMPILFER
jgi:hypothetical protein